MSWYEYVGIVFLFSIDIVRVDFKDYGFHFYD